MDPYHYIPGIIPLVISVPHAGTHVPGAILERFTPGAKRLADTDWHVDRLYDFARGLGAHMLIATHSRYVVDLNRRPDDASLYPGQFTTGLCPEQLFDGAPVYVDGALSEGERQMRVVEYWRPYHDRLAGLLEELGRAVLFDAHSIRSEVPALFEGRLPDLNLGTADGKSCDPKLAGELAELLGKSAYTSVHNGRFKGGYITRRYGRPAEGVQAVQLELAQVNYMDEDSFEYDEKKAAALQETLQPFVAILAQWATR